MYLEEIKDEKLKRLIKAANNAGGALCKDMRVALKSAKDEKEFQEKWMCFLRNEIRRQIGFYNDIAEKNGLELIGW